jgi:hypothetical protein
MELKLVSLKYVSNQWMSWYRATRVSSRTKRLHINTAQVTLKCDCRVWIFQKYNRRNTFLRYLITMIIIIIIFGIHLVRGPGLHKQNLPFSLHRTPDHQHLIPIDLVSWSCPLASLFLVIQVFCLLRFLSAASLQFPFPPILWTWPVHRCRLLLYE